MNGQRAQLDLLIEEFLNSSLSFDEFQRRYSELYIDREADRNFQAHDVDYYGGVHEKAEWTAQSPTAEERGYGWLTVDEYRRWLADHRNHWKA